MEIVKIVNGFARYDIDKQKNLSCFICNGKYNLILNDSSCGKATLTTSLVENKSRLATINKYASQYGVKFEI